jgi:hypothetical protein
MTTEDGELLDGYECQNFMDARERYNIIWLNGSDREWYKKNKLPERKWEGLRMKKLLEFNGK